MKIYYIESINEDTCRITTPSGLYTEVVDIEQLPELSKEHTVIGYNRITGKVSVKTAEDVYSHINSRRKLSGQEFVPNIEGTKLRIDSYDYIEIKHSKTKCKFILSDNPVRNLGYELDSLFSGVIIDFDYIFRNYWIDISYDYCGVNRSEFVYDLSSYVNFTVIPPDDSWGNESWESTQSMRDIYRVSIKNKKMFSNCKNIYEMFHLWFKKFSKDVDITALEGITFPKRKPEERMKACRSFIDTSPITLSKSFYRNVDCREAFVGCGFSEEEFNKMRNCVSEDDLNAIFDKVNQNYIITNEG